MLATLSLCNQAVSVTGPALGGLLIGAGGWRLTFAVNVPVSLACLLLGALRLPRTTAPAPATRTDGAGMLLFAASPTAFVLFLMHPAAGHWYLPVTGLVAGAAFVHGELSAGEPFLDLRVLGGNAPLLATYGRQLLAYTTSYAYLYGFSQWLQEGRGLSAPQAGLLMLPMPATAMAVTALTGRRSRARIRLVVGAGVQLLRCGALLFLGVGSPLWLLALLAGVVGIPQGLIGLADQNAVHAQADPARMGSSAGLLHTSMHPGALLASATTAATFRTGATSAGLHDLAGPLLGVAAAFLLVCSVDRSLDRVGTDR